MLCVGIDVVLVTSPKAFDLLTKEGFSVTDLMLLLITKYMLNVKNIFTNNVFSFTIYFTFKTIHVVLELKSLLYTLTRLEFSRV